MLPRKRLVCTKEKMRSHLQFRNTFLMHLCDVWISVLVLFCSASAVFTYSTLPENFRYVFHGYREIYAKTKFQIKRTGSFKLSLRCHDLCQLYLKHSCVTMVFFFFFWKSHKILFGCLHNITSNKCTQQACYLADFLSFAPRCHYFDINLEDQSKSYLERRDKLKT